MVSKWLASVVQLIASFNDWLRFNPPGRLVGGLFSMGSQHEDAVRSCRALPSNKLSCQCYRRWTCAEQAIGWSRTGCQDEPLVAQPSGCLIRQAVNNWSWSTGSRMMAKEGRRGMTSHTPSRAIIVRRGTVVVQRTATIFISTCPRTFPSPTTRSCCFEPSFPTRSERSCVVKIRTGDA